MKRWSAATPVKVGVDFDRVRSVHPIGSSRVPAGGEIPGEAPVAGRPVEQVAVDRQQQIDAIEFWDQVDRLAIGAYRAGGDRVA